MRAELLEKEVLTMYDVRGIQNYIFRTNRVKEIEGASHIIDDIIINGLNDVIEKRKWEKKKYITEWKNKTEDMEFLSDTEIEMQVMYIGGGNAYVLYRKGKVCQEVNRALAKYVFEKAYSLQLAVAVVEKTQDYFNDYRAITLEMRRVKAEMSSCNPVGAFPFMQIDPVTGYPLTTKNMSEKEEILSTESALKREMSLRCGNAKELDTLVTEKGENSMLAVVHIDGNNMGKRIGIIMQALSNENKSYEQIAGVVRGISSSIDTSFDDSLTSTLLYIDSVLKPLIKPDREFLYRKIIRAGDDITFVCNAKVAIEAVKHFLSDVSRKRISYKLDGELRSDDVPFSACAGIAFFHSHFPFSDAYEVAEACCGNAKKWAKKKIHIGKEEQIGNFFDFQMCGTVSAKDLGAYREKHYDIPLEGKGETITHRPYYVCSEDPDLDEKNKDHSAEILTKLIMFFNNTDIIPRNKAKELREACAKGSKERKNYINFLKSRQQKLPDNEECWFDSLEIADVYVGLNKEDDEDDNEET